ncbi:hypothetical protein E4U35_007003 [Claviceps purpurea]|uniref:Uncharacterized protein n=1 Tax=Claviceps purpurea (strain 20.1) TaxID=1111077 RepID=M1VWX1_CLAP2|nr:hypothetical protein E4U35_007003 [Claviceps purpurea]CCE32012.1 uncharacterized protein CPUR_05870 [Claviceps purpurea 20.1]
MASRRRIPKVANTRYFERYKLNRSIAQSQTQTPHNQASQAWWPEGSDPGGANVGVPPNQVESSGEGERLSRKRKRSSSSPSGELRGDDQKYDAEKAAEEVEKQASKRSRTRLNTMKVLPVEWYTLFLYLLCGLLCVILLVIAPKLSR